MPNPPTPTQLKVVRGTTRKDRANPLEPTPRVAARTVRAPAWLRLSPKARKAWSDISPLLIELRVLTDADRVALALLCDALAEYVEAKASVQEDGATYWTQGESSMQRTNPNVAIMQDAWRRAKIMLGEFGLTPSSRAKVATGGSKEQDPLEQWMGAAK